MTVMSVKVKLKNSQASGGYEDIRKKEEEPFYERIAVLANASVKSFVS